VLDLPVNWQIRCRDPNLQFRPHCFARWGLKSLVPRFFCGPFSPSRVSLLQTEHIICEHSQTDLIKEEPRRERPFSALTLLRQRADEVALPGKPGNREKSARLVVQNRGLVRPVLCGRRLRLAVPSRWNQTKEPNGGLILEPRRNRLGKSLQRETRSFRIPRCGCLPRRSFPSRRGWASAPPQRLITLAGSQLHLRGRMTASSSGRN